MNKSELVAAVAARAGSDQSQARHHVDAVFETIMKSVTEGERVVVTGFGTFDRVARPARTVRNPRTGRPIQVAASLAPRFSVGRTFKEHVSGAAPAAATEPGNVAAAATATSKVSASATVPDAPAPDDKKKKKGKAIAAAGGGKEAKAAKPPTKPTKSAKPGKAAKSAKSAKKAARKGK